MTSDSNTSALLGVGRLIAILETPVLVSRIAIHRDALQVETIDWNAYWAPAHALGAPNIDHAIEELHAVWLQYILSSFDAKIRRSYCYTYFRLLDAVSQSRRQKDEYYLHRVALRRTAAFECIAVTDSNPGQGTLVAATTTVRNPPYLLAKLKRPRALDDGRFLSLVTVPCDEAAPLFYNYRQYRLSADSPLSLMLYPAVPASIRTASFPVIDAFAQRVGPGIDPRVAQRARRLAMTLLVPLAAQHRSASARFFLELVDVGAGTGALSAALCRHLLKAELTQALGLRLWFVDICPASPARFFAVPSLHRVVDSLTYVGADYRQWLARTEPLPASPNLRIAILSKLFNNLSRFKLDSISTHVLPSAGVNASPSVCLAPGGAGSEQLQVGAKPLNLATGRTFDQGSLAGYYEALRVACGGDGECGQDHRTVPIRSFEPACLTDQNGESCLARLLERCQYVIIEDGDLRPADLVNHAAQFRMKEAVAMDLTHALGMSRNHVYLLAGAGQPLPPLNGHPLW